MVYISSEKKSGTLRTLWRQGSTKAMLLIDILNAFQDTDFSFIQTGRVIVNSSGGGYSSGFNGLQIGAELKQDEWFALSEMFQQMYIDAQTTLNIQGESGDVGQPNYGGLIFACMQADDRMQPVTRARDDFTGLRFPTYGPTTGGA